MTAHVQSQPAAAPPAGHPAGGRSGPLGGVVGLLLVSAVVFLAGIGWGLPSRAIDPYLFGERPVWTGQQIQELVAVQSVNTRTGADVDPNPVRATERPVLVNATDADRAEIVRRYRLYTHQPDEMNTMMALAAMRPGEGDLDPKMYKYGGLWVYPVGAALKAASIFGLIHVTGDLTYYLDHPEAFGHFYIVARLYVVAWALVGVWAAYWILRRVSGSMTIGLLGAACFAVMPVVVNTVHEAKPHLPGLVLVLLAGVAAARFVESGRRRWWVLSAILCGAAMGMVPATLPVFLVLPAMVLLRDLSWHQRGRIVLAGALLGTGVYFLTNPYVLINFYRKPELLAGHFQNSADFYRFGVGGDAIANALRLLIEGATAAVVAVAVVGGVGLLIRMRNRRRGSWEAGAVEGMRSWDIVWLLLGPALAAAIQFISFAGGQPSDYGRFALLPDVFLLLVAVAAISILARPFRARVALLVLLLVVVSAQGLRYVASFVRDSDVTNSRLLAARHLERFRLQGHAAVGVPMTPAPFSAPPMNLFEWRIYQLPQEDGSREVDLAVRPFDGPTPLSWADKPFRVEAGPHRAR